MPMQPGTLRPGELSEFPFRGPLGGIQSELPADFIEKYGVLDALNVIFRKGSFESRPGYETLPVLPAPSEVTGFANFWDSFGGRHQVAFTDFGLFEWNAAWSQKTGTLNASNLRMSWAVVAGKLLFAHLGTDKVKLWDGIAGTFADVSANAVPAQFLMEFDNRLLAMFTLEGVNVAPQRIRYTAPGDPTDWTSLAAGQYDLFNDLGPITGGVSLGQRAFATHFDGLSQLQITGNGLNPFFISKFSSKGKGNICPYSLDKFGDDMLFYIGANNVYMFDGNTSNPVGDFPLEGRLRGGARSRIFNDLRGAPLNRVVGKVVSGCNGDIYNAYIFSIPGVSVWVFNIDDFTWTRWAFDRTLSSLGTFFDSRSIRIMDLIGAISAQDWSPATLLTNSNMDCIGFGFTDGTVGESNFATPPESSWSITSGECAFSDYRHDKTEKKFRVLYKDLLQADLTLEVSNQINQVSTASFTVGGGNTGRICAEIVPVNINGYLLSWKITGPAGVNVLITEVTPAYDTGGEVRNP